MQAVWRGTIIAESTQTILVEGNHYFPPADVRWQYLHPSSNNTQTTCPWKGLADYFDVLSDQGSSQDVAWTYKHPKSEAEHIKDHVAFWKDVTVKSEHE